jgi:FkbM family methyltransferase
MSTKRFVQPFFLFQPTQVFRASYFKIKGKPNVEFNVRLPWGDSILVPPPNKDYVGHRLIMHGILAMEACEAAFRLCSVGNTVVDVGANVGVVTSALSYSVGEKGKVYAFEANPVTFSTLRRNLKTLRYQKTIHAFSYALSDGDGIIKMGLSDDYNNNIGVSYVTKNVTLPDNHCVEKVHSKKLDNVLSPSVDIKLLKMDIERHEYYALKGAEKLLSNLRIENIFFEDVDVGDTKTKELLWNYGYKIYKTETSLCKPIISEVPCSGYSIEGKSNNYSDFIATLDPQNLLNKYSSPGWKCFRFDYKQQSRT